MCKCCSLLYIKKANSKLNFSSVVRTRLHARADIFILKKATDSYVSINDGMMKIHKLQKQIHDFFLIPQGRISKNFLLRFFIQKVFCHHTTLARLQRHTHRRLATVKAYIQTFHLFTHSFIHAAINHPIHFMKHFCCVSMT